MLNELIQRIPESELRWIAHLDYGLNADKHLAALKQVLKEQRGSLVGDQSWFPYEVIQLGRTRLQEGHEEAFALCVLLVLRAVREGFDQWTGLHHWLPNCAGDFDRLSPDLRDAILAEFQAAANEGPET